MLINIQNYNFSIHLVPNRKIIHKEFGADVDTQKSHTTYPIKIFVLSVILHNATFKRVEKWCRLTHLSRRRLTEPNKYPGSGTIYTSVIQAQQTYQSTCLVPCHQSRRWSHVAFAADIALDSLRAWMTAAPRCCTVCRHTQTYFISMTLNWNLQ